MFCLPRLIIKDTFPIFRFHQLEPRAEKVAWRRGEQGKTRELHATYRSLQHSLHNTTGIHMKLFCLKID